jgi:phage baseplate assembly protein W
MPSWSMPDLVEPSPPVLTAAQKLLGRDVKFTSNYELGANGDYLVVEGVAAAKQSMLNEARTTPGELVSVPEYGMGLSALVYLSASRSNRDEAANRVRERLAANPRIERTDEVSVDRDAERGVTVITARTVVAGREVLNTVSVEDRA